jgi:hypothetical protein
MPPRRRFFFLGGFTKQALKPWEKYSLNCRSLLFLETYQPSENSTYPLHIDKLTEVTGWSIGHKEKKG